MTDNTLTLVEGGELEQFDPERFQLKQAAVNYTIEHAKRIKDWPALEKAVDLKIDEQQKFIAWREANIRSDGRPLKNGPGTGTVLMSDKEISELSGIGKRQFERLRSKLTSPDKYRAYLLGSEYMAAFLEPAQNVRGTMGTGENEWFTPEHHIELVRCVLGDIDLDPASSFEAQKIVRAKRYFDKDSDGLKQEWFGRVYLNSPYGTPLISLFMTKLHEQWVKGNIEGAITLTHNYTDTAWFQSKLVPIASAICFTYGRVKFYEGDHVAAPQQGQAFVYLGNDPRLFVNVFAAVGFVATELTPCSRMIARAKRRLNQPGEVAADGPGTDDDLDIPSFLRRAAP
jgi:hypothetical protein